MINSLALNSLSNALQRLEGVGEECSWAGSGERLSWTLGTHPVLTQAALMQIFKYKCWELRRYYCCILFLPSLAFEIGPVILMAMKKRRLKIRDVWKNYFWQIILPTTGEDWLSGNEYFFMMGQQHWASYVQPCIVSVIWIIVNQNDSNKKNTRIKIYFIDSFINFFIKVFPSTVMCHN